KEKCDTLKIENELLAKAQAKFSHDKQDIVEFLNLKVSEHERQIASLEDRIERLLTDHSHQVERLKATAEDAAEEARNEAERLSHMVAKQEKELEMLNDFKRRKGEMEQEVEALKAQLVEKERAYKEAIHSLERKVLQDKSHLKKEMLAKVDTAVTSFRRIADQQMADTTKRAIRENMAVTSQLHKMSATTAELIRDNDALKEKCAKMKLANSLLLETESQLAKKNYAAQRVIGLLREKIKDSDMLLEAAFAEQDRKEARARELAERRLSAIRQDGESRLRTMEYANQDLQEENTWLSGRLKEVKKTLRDVWNCLQYQEDSVMWQSEVRKAMDHLASMTESQLLQVGNNDKGADGPIMGPSMDRIVPTGWSPESSSVGTGSPGSSESFRQATATSATSSASPNTISTSSDGPSVHTSQLIEHISKLKDRQAAFPSELLDQVEQEAVSVGSSTVSFEEKPGSGSEGELDGSVNQSLEGGNQGSTQEYTGEGSGGAIVQDYFAEESGALPQESN
ncbi:hypothetical protein HDU93_004196, partial [Gonapodya sp. JEL0774]